MTANVRTKLRENCPDCAAPIGAAHRPGCDVERCRACGRQRIGCNCPESAPLPWTGRWPGDEDCERLGLLMPDGSPHLTALYLMCRWDPATARWENDRYYIPKAHSECVIPLAALPHPNAWSDISWGNDTCASLELTIGGRTFVLWSDYPNPTQREIQGAKRFSLCGGEGETIGDADTDAELCELLQRVTRGN